MAYYLTATSYLYPFVPAAEVIKLTDDDADGVADLAILSGLIDAAEEMYHTYVAHRHTVPVTGTRAVAVSRMYCARLWEYLAFSRRRAVTQEIGARYAQTIKELRDIADGNMRLDDPPPSEASTVGGRYTATEYDRDFTAATMKDWGGGSPRGSEDE